MKELLEAVKPFRDIFRDHFDKGKYKTYAPQEKDLFEKLADAYDKAIENEYGANSGLTVKHGASIAGGIEIVSSATVEPQTVRVRTRKTDGTIGYEELGVPADGSCVFSEGTLVFSNGQTEEPTAIME